MRPLILVVYQNKLSVKHSCVHCGHLSTGDVLQLEASADDSRCLLHKQSGDPILEREHVECCYGCHHYATYTLHSPREDPPPPPPPPTHLLKLYIIWLSLNLLIPGKVTVAFGTTILLQVCA